MTDTKHTPGPWVKTEGNLIKCDLRPIGLTADAGMIVASVVGGPSSGSSFPQNADEVEANARLITAAPDMLKMLEDIDRIIEENTGPAQLALSIVARMADIRSTIRKATQP